MTRVLTVALVATVALAACSGDDAADSAADTTVTAGAAGDRFPQILEVEPSYDASSMTWSFAVTVSSAYDTPERYADGWRVTGPDGTVYGVHTLAHDHANEQPFTRRQSGVTIPDDVEQVTVEGRDLVNGFGGVTRTVDLDRSS